jgi:nucleoside-diphosphate-sugar epimerase
MPYLFCCGFGYAASHVATHATAQGWKVQGTHRNSGPYILNDTTPLTDVSRLNDVTHLLVSIPPDEQGNDPALTYHGQYFATLPHLKWVGLISSTGVYGDHQGNWVDETAATIPHARLSFEEKWRQLNLPLHIFRLAALYGPGRSPMDRIQAGHGQIIDKPGHYFSRIHVDDVATLLFASMQRPAPGECYNLADDHPATSREVMEHAYELLGLPPPPPILADDAALPPEMRKYYQANRRVRNDKIKKQLGIALRYPSYQEGLRQVMEAR